MISLLTIPFLVSIVLVLIHVYFGSFVLRRGVIFIDLALAQWAALGYLIGHWMDIHQPLPLFILGFAFTVIASLLLTILKPYFDKTNLLEAVIGVLYLSAITIATSIISSTGMEGHHLKEMLSGHLLFIQVNEMLLAYGLYAIVALILVLLIFTTLYGFFKKKSRVFFTC